MPVEIHRNKLYSSYGFVALHWLKDFSKFGVTLKQLFNPATKALGVEFTKGKKIIGVTFGPEDPGWLPVARAMRLVEKEFGIPDEASPYNKILQEFGVIR